MPTDFDMSTLDVEDRTCDELLDMAVDNWGNEFRVATGFGLEDLVILHKLHQRGAKPLVFFIDTGRHFEHTYAAADAARDAFGLELQYVWPDPAQLRLLMKRDGPSSIVRDVDARRRCCEVRRGEPLTRALKGSLAWLVGARRDQCSARSSLKKLTIDKDHDWIPRVAPLADWSWRQVVEYVNENKLPTSTLFRKSYTSVGCAPCTRAIRPGEPERAGRWAFEDAETRERGRHLSGSW
ncbi:MAG: phosphoadenosine phosphosulfate reductase [Myxococcota bacterium]